MDLNTVYRSARVLALKAERRKYSIQWPNPEESIGVWYRSLGRVDCWEMCGPAQQQYLALVEQIKEHFEKHGETVTATVVWSAYMIGRCKEKANPTVVFCSHAPEARKSVRDEIEGSGILASYPGFRTAESNILPHLGRLQQLDNHEQKIIHGCDSLERCNNLIDRTIQIKHEDPPSRFSTATVGAVMQTEAEVYLMTVLHIFASQDLWKDQEASNFEFVFDDTEDFSDDELEDSDGADSFVIISSSDLDICEEECAIEATTMLDGALQSDVSHSIATDDYTSSTDDIVFPPLSPRRTTETTGAVDYCLIRLDPTDKQLSNAIVERGGMPCVHHIQSRCTEAPQLQQRSSVVAYTGSRKAYTGVLSGTPTFLTIPGGSATQELWSVHLEGKLEEGDYWSTVIDNTSGELIGNIIAGSPLTGMALIMPLYQVMDDLRKNFDPVAEVSRLCKCCENTILTDKREPVRNTTDVDDKGDGMAISPTLQFRQMLSAQRMAKLQLWRRQQSCTDKSSINQGFSSMPIRNIPLYPQQPSTAQSMRFRNSLVSLSRVPIQWEEPGLLDEALAHIPLQRIYEEADEEFDWLLAEALTAGEDCKPTWDHQDCVARALMKWFKEEFFEWVNNPHCSICQSPTIALGMTSPDVEESHARASRVELYRCSNHACQAHERFPRYNNASILLRTRKGRVGEWANCFGLLCRSIGARVRWVWNAEDQVWVELWSNRKRRWIHVDVCEGAWDQPLLYTVGWHKKLSYCIAFSADNAVDVTRRYVRDQTHALPRTKATEAELGSILNEIRLLPRGDLDGLSRQVEQIKDLREQDELAKFWMRSIVKRMWESLEEEMYSRSCPGW